MKESSTARCRPHLLVLRFCNSFRREIRVGCQYRSSSSHTKNRASQSSRKLTRYGHAHEQDCLRVPCACVCARVRARVCEREEIHSSLERLSGTKAFLTAPRPPGPTWVSHLCIMLHSFICGISHSFLYASKKENLVRLKYYQSPYLSTHIPTYLSTQ
jgi:hypothetical protein